MTYHDVGGVFADRRRGGAASHYRGCAYRAMLRVDWPAGGGLSSPCHMQRPMTGCACITRKPGRGPRLSSCTSSRATCAPGSRRCGISRIATARSPTMRAAIRPSEVPEDPARYGQTRAADDIAAVMDAAGIDRAHICGLSMGGFATLHFGFRHAGPCALPDRGRLRLRGGTPTSARSSRPRPRRRRG